MVNLTTPSSYLSIRPAPTALHTLSLHDALPISCSCWRRSSRCRRRSSRESRRGRSPRSMVPTPPPRLDRKSTRLNSSHTVISYAVFCLKKKNPGLEDEGHAPDTKREFCCIIQTD